MAEKATQSRHPWRATFRTIIAGGLGALSILPTVAMAAGVEDHALVAQAVVVSGAVTRILALPSVDGFLRRYAPWLAAAPKTVAPPR